MSQLYQAQKMEAIGTLASVIDLTCTCSEEKILVHWNDTQLQQVLLNLITNASHALTGVVGPIIQIELNLFSNNQAFRDMRDGCT
ncbi:MAG: hypothetical protein Q9M17_02365 [Mariprofundus sp.]|nr:hypothetical protein [Mariprofundus sp.]